tara:strand:- start:1105 stop:1719 length:615 start_codon:yes stop_codon:yes gene_type:complete
MSRRRLSDEERALWKRVARTAEPLRPSPDPNPDIRKAPLPDPDAPAPPGPPVRFKPNFQIPRATPAVTPRIQMDLAEPVGERLARQRVAMDKKLHRTMMRGRMEPDARIDLHGMTAAQAHQALTGFILSAHARGHRLVLVITGKGRKPAHDHLAPMPARAGILKHQVPHWLSSAPLGSLVLDLRESHRSHGGAGAYYVYLRKRR